ncbi:MAG: tRNA lysidine(34) synthetase TilS [Micrococcaceae bacterium]
MKKINPITNRKYGKPALTVSKTRNAVENFLQDYPAGAKILVCCSGGADSMALADAISFVSQYKNWEIAAVVVNHQLQKNSTKVANKTETWLKDHGYQVFVRKVTIADGAIETNARTARYAAFEEVASEWRADIALTAHHRDDQAETVLLGLLRGSGTKSLAGIPPKRDIYGRPFLDLSKTELYAACKAENVPYWEDLSNADSITARNTIRNELLPEWEQTIGSDLKAPLARTAKICREDAEAIGVFVDIAWDKAGLNAKKLAKYPASVRKGVLSRAALKAGTRYLSYTHLETLDSLIVRWHGQDAVPLPGKISCIRVKDTLSFVSGDSQWN